MNEIATNRLRDAMRNANVAEIDEIADEIGREAVAVALANQPAQPTPMAHVLAEEERQRLLDAALADAIEMVARHRQRLGRRVCSRPDATTTRVIYEHLRSMVDATGGVDNDPSFQ
jgi:hypothetical protein